MRDAPSRRLRSARCAREGPHVPGAPLAPRPIVRRAEDSTFGYGLGAADLAAWRERRQPFAEVGFADRERKAARSVRIAVVGGTGDFGLALARRLVEAGDDVVIGSRDADRAAARGAEISAAGAANEDAVRGSELVVLAVKADAALPTAESLVAAIGDTPVLSVASGLRFTKTGVFPADDRRSIAERTQELLGAPVAAGLHSLAAASLADGPAHGDALVCGDDADAKELALAVAAKVITGRALDAGPLASARALEGLTAVIVNLNKRYRGHAGVEITGLP